VIEEAKLGVKKAESDLTSAEKAQKAVIDTMEENLKIAMLPDNKTPLPEDQKEIRRQRDPDLLKANTVLASARIAVDAAKLKEKQAAAAAELLAADTERANAAVARVKAQVAKATAVIESYKLRAQVAGTVEQIGVTEGMAVGPTGRTPLLYIVPTGPRVVRAEVEAEFAHKIDSFVGKPVVICAGPNFADTYAGTARRVSGAFLPKRFGGDSLVGNTTRVLECVIEISEPTPADKPPLRPGQPVRVKFGQ
jgi:multidrug resistance efflux pump